MKYEIIDYVSRFTKRVGLVMDTHTMMVAKEEGGAFDFRRISAGHYACVHGSKMYVIIEKAGRIGCSCDDMTYNRTDGTACKHIIAFTKLVKPVEAKLDRLDAAHLRNVAGWCGTDETLHPGSLQIPPDPELDLGVGDPLPEPKTTPKPAAKPAVCENCKVQYTKPKPKPEEKEKMKSTWNQAAWDAATQGSFATFDDRGVAILLFTANDFEVGKRDKWGRSTYEFAVIQHDTAVILTVGSIRLMSALKTILPIEGKKVEIKRTGEGTGTQYTVVDISGR